MFSLTLVETLFAVKVVEPCVTVPIQGYTVSAMGVPKYMFYSVNIDSYNFNSSTSSSPLSGSGKQAIIDSGTTINYLPTSIANAYNALFQPPATYSFVDGNYHVDCNAKVPSFAVTIGGKKFTIDKKDQILPNGIGSDGKLTCITGTSDGGDPADSYSIFVLFVFPLDIRLEDGTLNVLQVVIPSCIMSYRRSTSTPREYRYLNAQNTDLCHSKPVSFLAITRLFDGQKHKNVISTRTDKSILTPPLVSLVKLVS